MAVIRGLVLLFLVFSLEYAAAKTCSVGWQRFGSKCFRFFPQRVNWATAEKSCQGFGGNLASVRTKVRNDFLLSLVPSSTRAWIGGHDGEVDGQWLWSNGARFDYTNWCRGEPNNHQNPENCLELNFSAQNNLCFRSPGAQPSTANPPRPSPTTIATPANTCSVGWQRFGAKCFRFFPQTVHWATAEKICQVFGGNLASVRTKVKNDFLLSLVPSSTRAWIGGHDGEVDGQWLWSNGARFDYTNWCRGEPNNHQNPENCLELNFSGNRCWNDVPCSDNMGYICGRKPS